MNTNIQWKRALRSAVVAATAIAASGAAAVAQDHAHGAPSPAQPLSSDQQQATSQLVADVRQATARYQDVLLAQRDGYALGFGCVSGSGGEGAMGMHFINSTLVGDAEVRVDRPEIILYEPSADGSLRITGADYLVDAATWDAAHAGPPQLEGQLFHYFESPNRFGLKPFYTLHVWAWKDNPNGAFANWNPAVSCDAFSGTSR